MEPTPLEYRMSRLAVLVIAFAVAAGILGVIPRGFEDLQGDRHTTMAGGASVAAWAVSQALGALRARATPTRRTGWAWFAASFLITVGGTVYWLLDQFTLADQIARWPAEAMWACIGTTLVVTTLVLPIVLIVSDNESPPVPEARVHDSSG